MRMYNTVHDLVTSLMNQSLSLGFMVFILRQCMRHYELNMNKNRTKWTQEKKTIPMTVHWGHLQPCKITICHIHTSDLSPCKDLPGKEQCLWGSN